MSTLQLHQHPATYGGLDSYLTTSQFADLVHKHAYQPNIRFHVSRWGSYNGAPPETCTMTVGNIHDGQALNVPMPDIPARSVIDPKTEKVVHQGWRSLMVCLLQWQVVRPNLDFEMYLGSNVYKGIMVHLGIRDRKRFKFDLKGVDGLAASVSQSKRGDLDVRPPNDAPRSNRKRIITDLS